MNNTLTIALLNDQYLRASRGALFARASFHRASEAADKLSNAGRRVEAIELRDQAIAWLDKAWVLDRVASRHAIAAIDCEVESPDHDCHLSPMDGCDCQKEDHE